MYLSACRTKTTVAVACLFAIVLVSTLRSESKKAPATSNATTGWPQFLGPDRNGISHETGLIAAWPQDGPSEMWRVKGGQGPSGLALAGGKLFTLVQKEGRQWLVCLDALTGKSQWEKDLAPEYRNQMGDGPRATPAVAGDTVYAFTGEGILAALKTADGQVVWKKNLVSEFGGKPAEYGMAGSPLVVGKRVVVTVGAPEATVVAVEGATGEVVWKAGQDSPAGYSSPVVLKVADRELIAVFHGEGGLGLDPATGAELWSYPYLTDFNCNIAAPVAVDGGVFLSAGENHGSVLLALKPHGDKFDVSEVWNSQGPKSVLRNEWQTSILLDGYLYGFDNVGGAGPISHLTCIDAKTGERQWQQLRFGKGNLIAADGKLFICTIQGELVVVNANPKKFEELGRKMVIGKTRQAPALAGGLLYLRDEREIVCLDVRRK
jgi:outer membrane protein assembly factor BamB